jgi:NarL family two-component system response regulator LiaR
VTSTATPPISVLIVDDHAVVREGLRTFLALQDGIEVVGEAADGREALAAEAELSPDVILMDLVMPVLDGVQAMCALHERGSRSHVIVLTSFLDDDRILPAIRAGAAGYLLKDVEPAQLAAAVRGATGERAAIDPTVAARLLHQLSDPTTEATQATQATQAGAPAWPVVDRLTRREREVLCLIAAGRSNKRIALELGIAEKTVKTHVGHVLAKLGVADRTQAALLAVRAGLAGLAG